ncbi:hypothetical protein IAT40_002468 [Kwoniella sp. CBS 6097]
MSTDTVAESNSNSPNENRSAEISPTDSNKKKKSKPTKSKSKPIPVPVGPFEQPAEDEERTVHAVYEAIAPHFSQTRHKPWPLISSFLRSLPPNSIGVDSGAGNGKYLPVSREANAQMIALDRSSGLLSIAKEENDGECVRGDLGFSGWREGVFDFAISVAAIHHLSTPERRQHSVQTLLRPLALNKLPPYSRFMIYVWAYEQGEMSKRRMGVLANANTNADAPSERGVNDGAAGESAEIKGMSSLSVEDEKDAIGDQDGRLGGEKVQDVLVPWVYSKPGQSSKRKPAAVRTKTKKDPRKHVRDDATAQPKESSNNEASAGPDVDGSRDAESSPAEKYAGGEAGGIPKFEAEPEFEPEQTGPQVFHRYYHLFVEGELRSMVIQAGEKEDFVILPDGTSDPDFDSIDDITSEIGRSKKWMRVRAVGWEADNWWLEGEVGLFP